MTVRSRLWFAAFVLVVFVLGGFSGVVFDRLWLVERGRGALARADRASAPVPAVAAADRGLSPSRRSSRASTVSSS